VSARRGWENRQSSAPALAAQAGDLSFPVWVLAGDGGVVVGRAQAWPAGRVVGAGG
jgi:hypothetical protein